MTIIYKIRQALPEDTNTLPELELQAAALFKEYDLPECVIAGTSTAKEFKEAQEAGHLLAAVLPNEQVIGFALMEIIDMGVHLAEVDVLPSYGRKGVGASLVKSVCSWAEKNGFKCVTLTTFKDVPWNAPFYRKLGFRVMNPDEYPPDIIFRVKKEHEQGLLQEDRCAMIYEL